MQQPYSYPPPNGEGNSQGYPSSPSTSNPTTNPPVNLPSIRQLDERTAAPPQHQVPSQPTGQPSPLPVPSSLSSGGYYPQQALPQAGQGVPAHLASHELSGQQYALSEQARAQAQRNRAAHEKQIKRRTKTGCLTCRKRRIKCDETHPACRNCEKSKRECLGYDPIFKQQPAGPAQIQPAPSVASPSAHSTASSTTPSYPHPIPSQQGLTPSQPAPSPAFDSHSVGPNPSASPQVQSSHGASSTIDPSLANSSGPSMSEPVATESHLPNHLGSSMAFARRLKRLTPPNLYAVSGIGPPDQIPDGFGAPDPETLQTIEKVYLNDYGLAMDYLLEVDWYIPHGFRLIQRDHGLFSLFHYVVHLFQTVPTEDYDGNRRIQGLEAKLIWQIMCLCKTAEVPTINGTNGAASDRPSMLEQVIRRLEIFEKLLTWQVADSNPVAYLNYPEYSESSPEWKELKFWELLGIFVSYRGDEETQAQSIDSAIRMLREHFLAVSENRDILYSIVIAQHIGGITPGFPNAPDAAVVIPDGNSERLAVAQKHILDATSGRSCQLYTRIASMVIVSWSA